MLNRNLITEVLMQNFNKLSTGASANDLATQMELPPGSVVFGAKHIDISDGQETIHAQYTAEGGVDFVNI